LGCIMSRHASSEEVNVSNPSADPLATAVGDLRGLPSMADPNGGC
jgi:hypothetical protein